MGGSAPVLGVVRRLQQRRLTRLRNLLQLALCLVAGGLDGLHIDAGAVCLPLPRAESCGALRFLPQPVQLCHGRRLAPLQLRLQVGLEAENGLHALAQPLQRHQSPAV